MRHTPVGVEFTSGVSYRWSCLRSPRTRRLSHPGANRRPPGCACFANIAVLRSKGFTITPPHPRFCRGWNRHAASPYSRLAPKRIQNALSFEMTFNVDNGLLRFLFRFARGIVERRNRSRFKGIFKEKARFSRVTGSFGAFMRRSLLVFPNHLLFCRE